MDHQRMIDQAAELVQLVLIELVGNETLLRRCSKQCVEDMRPEGRQAEGFERY